jgi:DNA-damage-inducible protein J
MQCSYIVPTVEESSMLTVDVRARVEPELKKEAAAVLKASGLNVSTAIRLFLRAVVATGGLPTAVPTPNAKTPAAIRAAKAGEVTPISLEDL